MFTVVVTEKGGKKKKLAMENATAFVGREQGNDIVLALGNVSKKHCRLDYQNGRFVVEDIGSTNGTYLNGRKIPGPTIVEDGDKVYVGEFILTLERPASQPVGEAPQPNHRPSRPPIPTPKPKVRKSVPPPRPKASKGASEDNSGGLSSLSPDQEARLPEVKSDFQFEGRQKSSMPPPPSRKARPIKGDDSGRLEQLVDFVALEVTSIDRTDLPTRMDEGSAAKVRMVLKGMINELVAENKLDEKERPHTLLMDAFLAVVDMGPIGELLADRTVTEIQIAGADNINVRTANGWGISNLRFDSGWDLTRAVRCLGAGLSGAAWDGTTGCARFRLETGELVVAQTGPVTETTVVRFYKSLSSRLDRKAGISASLVKEALAPVREVIAAGGRIAVCGESFTGRLSLCADLVRLLPLDDLVVVAEAIPLLGVGGENRVGLHGWSIDKGKVPASVTESLLAGASQLNPEWIVASGTGWTDVPAIFGMCAQRGRVVAELPMAGGEQSGPQLAAGLLSSGIATTPEHALQLLRAAFDLVVVVKRKLDGTPIIGQVCRIEENADDLLMVPVYDAGA